MAPASETVDRDNDLDSLFNYDIDNNDLFREIDTNIQAPENASAKRKATELGGGLGIDEEITITKKRKPVAKLDEARLLSQAGIPKLRRTAKEKLKFKGKGHEYADCLHLLNFYQLWLDDLYPRAKFADGLAIIEKLGHSKRMQVMRKAWIDESKPKLYDDFDLEELSQENTSSGLPASGSEILQHVERVEEGREGRQAESTTIFRDEAFNGERKAKDSNNLFFTDDEDEAPTRPRTHDVPGDDDLDALLAERETSASEPKQTPASRPPASDPDEDDLDALLAERSVPNNTKPKENSGHRNGDVDELEALPAEHPDAQPARSQDNEAAGGDDDQDALDALLAE